MNLKNKRLFGAMVGFCFALTACGGGGGTGGTSQSENDPTTQPDPSTQPIADTTPDPFVFEPVTNAEPGKEYVANTRISGIDAPAGVKVAGGTYSLDGENFSDKPGEIRNGQRVFVRTRASAEKSGKVEVKLDVGTRSATFDVTTRANFNPPDVVVEFPPAHSMTDVPLPGLLHFRGKASDDNEIDRIEVDGQPANYNAKTGEWSFDYQLKSGLQDVVIVAIDTSDNRNEAIVPLRHEGSMDGIDFGSIGRQIYRGLCVDQASGLLYHGSGYSALSLFDPDSGEGAVIYEDSAVPQLTMDDFDCIGDFAYIPSGHSDDGLGRINLAVGSGESLSVKGDGKGDDTFFDYTYSVGVTSDETAAFELAKVSNDWADGEHLWKVDIGTGNRTQISTSVFTGVAGVVRVDELRDRLLVAQAGQLYAQPLSPPGESYTVEIDNTSGHTVGQLAVDNVSGKILAVGRKGGRTVLMEIAAADNSVTIISDGSFRDTGPLWEKTSYLDADWKRRIAYISSGMGMTIDPEVIMAIDMTSGHRVVVARVNP